jgi:EamA-like transporter family
VLRFATAGIVLGIVFTEAWLDALILPPLALWQTVGSGYHLTTRDLVAGVILGVVCTALAYMMWTFGMGRIKVQLSAILGYLEPVSAPLYALLLLGQGILVWTVIGGALIVAAGLLVVLLGEHEEEGLHRWSRRLDAAARADDGRRRRGANRRRFRYASRGRSACRRARRVPPAARFFLFVPVRRRRAAAG